MHGLSGNLGSVTHGIVSVLFRAKAPGTPAPGGNRHIPLSMGFPRQDTEVSCHFLLHFLKFLIGGSFLHASQVALVVKNLLAMQEMQGMQVSSLGGEDPLEEEPGGLQSMGSQIRHEQLSMRECTKIIASQCYVGFCVQQQ